MKDEGSIQENRTKRYDQDYSGNERAWDELRDDREMHGSGRDGSPVPCKARISRRRSNHAPFCFQTW